jgi:hypothetical protein
MGMAEELPRSSVHHHALGKEFEQLCWGELRWVGKIPQKARSAPVFPLHTGEVEWRFGLGAKDVADEALTVVHVLQSWVIEALVPER